MNDFKMNVDDCDVEVEAFLDEIQGYSIVGLYLSEENDSMALEFEDGKLLEFSEEGCLVLIDQEGGQRPILQLKKEQALLAELTFWGFAGY
jgi:hypothetical protein